MKKTPKKYIGSSPMKFEPITMAAIQMGAGLVGGAIDYFGNRKAKKEAEEKGRIAQREADTRLQAYKDKEFVNPYENMQNVYEDATIDQRAAEFQRDANAQSQADTLAALQAGGGTGAGTAALATAMSRQGAQQAQAAAANIGAQERQNQQMALAETGRLQDLNIAGQEQVRRQEEQREIDLYGLSAGIADTEAGLASAAQSGMNTALGGAIADVGAGFLPGGVFDSGGTPTEFKDMSDLSIDFKQKPLSLSTSNSSLLNP